jgi:DNA repair protein RadC
VIYMDTKETTSTNTANGDEVNKGSDLSEIPKDDIRTVLIESGTGQLTLQELLEVLFLSGCKGTAAETASDLLNAFDQNIIDVFTASLHQLTQVKGIDFERACQVKATFELAKRIASYTKVLHPEIASTEDVVHVLAPRMKFLKQEEFRVLLLDSKKRLIRHCQVSLGSLDAALVEPRDVFRPAITAGAPFIIVVHNHPSGDPTPSDQDILLTQQLCLSGKILGIEVVDHIIIGFSDHISLKEKKLM